MVNMEIDKITAFLKDWALEFIKNKNLVTKSIKDIQDKGNFLLIKHKDKEQKVIIIPFLNSFYDAFKELSAEPEMHLTVVTFNCDQSFKAMLDNWNELIKHRNLSIYFANPFSMIDKKWIIFPHTHAKICDEESFETGLKSMFETVDKITEEEAKRKI